MNYVRTILITIALLNMHYTYNGQMANDSKDTIENILESISTEEPKIEAKQENSLQTWNDHLALLTSSDDYWDAQNNIPTEEWENTAFDLARKVLEQNKDMADTLTTSFIDALNAKKITDIKGVLALIEEFKTFIANQVATITSNISEETKGSTPPAPIVPEMNIPSTPESVIEPVPVPTETSGATSSSSEEEATSSATEQSDPQSDKNQLKKTWQEQLEKVQREGKNGPQFEEILNKTYETAKELLKNEIETESTLQTQFRKALIGRSDFAKIKKLYNDFYNDFYIEDIMYYFNNALGISSYPSPTQFNEPSRFPEPNMFDSMSPDQSQQEIVNARDQKRDEEFEKLKKEYAEKDARFKEFEKEQEKAELERKQILAAAQKAQEEGSLAQEQVYKLAEAQKKLKEEYEAKRAQDRKDMEDARKSLINYTEQVAAAQKAAATAAAEKGLVSTFTDTLSNWWYGPTAQKSSEPSLSDQEHLLTMMVKDLPHHVQPAAKQAFRNFQNTLLSFNAPEFWNTQREIPNITWITRMDDLIKDVVVTYKLMSITDISAFVQSILQKSSNLSPSALNEIMAKILIKTKQALAEEEREKAVQQQAMQRRQEKKEQILLAEQRAKAEKERIEAEKQKRIYAAHTYKTEKKQWYDLLDKVAQNKQATSQDNHAHMQEALEKSQSLLRLAGDIPDKNKSALSQKLKQKFSVALLEQQKNGDGLVNVHHHMDLFNKEINKILD